MAKLVYYINYCTINNDINEDGCGHIFYKKKQTSGEFVFSSPFYEKERKIPFC